jgi:hypothetical protein
MRHKTALGILQLLAMAMFAVSGTAADVYVNGTNTYPADVINVQAAIAADTTVNLSGTFNFGTDGFVWVNFPNVTLQGTGTTTKIVGGTYPISTLDLNSDPYPEASGATNLTVRNIRFENWLGFAIYAWGIQDESNHTLIENNTLVNSAFDPLSVEVLGIHYCTSKGSAIIRNNTLENLTWLAVSNHALTLHPEDSLEISGNTITNCHYDAICPAVFDPGMGNVDNGPVIVRKNRIHTVLPWAWGIAIGVDYWEGVSNETIEGNVLTGFAAIGVMNSWYGHNHKVINNDFSGLTVWLEHILAMSQVGVVSGNVFGPIDELFAASMGTFPTGILVYSEHPWWTGGPMPDPTTGWVIMNNDYRRTGLLGWHYDAQGTVLEAGCVLLGAASDLYPGSPSNVVSNNLIEEVGRFPAGTGGSKQQVLEFPVGAFGNRIVGHAANEYAQLEGTNPGIGQKIKEAGAKTMKMMAQRRAAIASRGSLCAPGRR